MRLPLAAALFVLLGPGLAVAQRDGSRNPSFNLANRSPQSIDRLFATPSATDRWGQDRLQRFSLPSGGTFPVRLPADGTCVYDIQVVFADGSTDERRRVDTCATEVVAFGRGAVRGSGQGSGQGQGQGQARSNDPSFRLLNRSRSEVSQVYASPSGTDDWGRDRLGDDTVRAGGTFVLRLPQGECTWDIRVVFANREIVERRSVDLCGITDLRVP